jgi:hypothetical protein
MAHECMRYMCCLLRGFQCGVLEERSGQRHSTCDLEVQRGLLMAERVLFAPQFEQKRGHL